MCVVSEFGTGKSVMRFINPFRNATLLAGAAALVSSMLPLAANAAISIDQFTVIAGGWQLERQCGHLTSEQHDALGEITAHAEVDAARRHGAAKVREVLDGAEQFGQEMGANCGDETHDAVNSAYGMAQQYVVARNAETTRQTERKRKKKKRSRTVTATPEVNAPRRSALARFGSQTEAYYLQRRCRHLPYKQDLAFWKLIRKHHYALIGRYGAGAVGRVSRRAKHNAYSASVYCGAKTRSMVYAGLHTIRGDRSVRY